MKKIKCVSAFALTLLFVFYVFDAQPVSAFDGSDMQIALLKRSLFNSKYRIEISNTEKAEISQMALDNMVYLFQKVNESGVTEKDLNLLRGFMPESTYSIIESIVAIAPADMSVKEKMSVLMEATQFSDNCKLALSLVYSGFIGAAICWNLVRPYMNYDLGNNLGLLFAIEIIIGWTLFSLDNCAVIQ